MPRNIAIVVGSPRRGGNTWMLAEAFARGAEESGHRVEFINAGNADIAGCIGCEYCFSHAGICFRKDDMTAFYGVLRRCDTIVYATPVYCFSFPAQMKAFMDRMFCGMADPFPLTSCCLLTAFEDKDPSAARPLVDAYRMNAAYAHMKDEGMVCASGFYEKGAIADSPALDEAYELGRSLSSEPVPAPQRVLS